MECKDIDAFLAKRLILDCPKIILTPCSSSLGKRRLSGAGTISAEESGRFLLKVFFEESFPSAETFENLNWKAGKVIDEKYYYDLEAHDLSGRTWKSERVLPDRSVGPSGSMITASFQDLAHTGAGHPKAEGTLVKFYFDEIVKVPLNTVIREEAKADEKLRSRSASLRLARFSSQDVQLEV